MALSTEGSGGTWPSGDEWVGCRREHEGHRGATDFSSAAASVEHSNRHNILSQWESD